MTAGDGMYHVIDVHTHIGDWPVFNVRADEHDLSLEFAEYNVVHAAVFCPDNESTRSAVSAISDTFGFYWADPRQPGYVEEAARYLDDGFKGVKLHPLLDGFHPCEPALKPLMEMLSERGNVPVLIHTGHPVFSEPLAVARYLVSPYPDVPVILGHMGHGNVFYIEDCIGIAEEFPNAYLDTSGVVMPAKIGEAEYRAPGKTLFGSDYPCHPYEMELSKVTRWSGLSAPEVENVLYHNAMSLLFSQPS